MSKDEVILRFVELNLKAIQALAWPAVILIIFIVLINYNLIEIIVDILKRTTKAKFGALELEMKAAEIEADVKNIASNLPSIPDKKSSQPSIPEPRSITANQKIDPFSQEARIEYGKTLNERQRWESMDRMKNFYKQIILDNWASVESTIREFLYSNNVSSSPEDHDEHGAIMLLEQHKLVSPYLVEIAYRLWSLKNEAQISPVPPSQTAATSYRAAAHEFSTLIKALQKPNP